MWLLTRPPCKRSKWWLVFNTSASRGGYTKSNSPGPTRSSWRTETESKSCGSWMRTSHWWIPPVVGILIGTWSYIASDDRARTPHSPPAVVAAPEQAALGGSTALEGSMQAKPAQVQSVGGGVLSRVERIGPVLVARVPQGAGPWSSQQLAELKSCTDGATASRSIRVLGDRYTVGVSTHPCFAIIRDERSRSP